MNTMPDGCVVESYRIIDEQADAVDIGATLNGKMVERLATERARQAMKEPIAHEKVFLRTNERVLAGLPDFDEIMKIALQDAVDQLVKKVVEELDILPLDDPFVRLLDGEVADSLDVMVTIPIVPDAKRIDGINLSLKYHPVVKSGSEVDTRIEEACEQYNVANECELIEKTGLYGSVEEMRGALEESLDAYVEGLNKRSLKEAVCDALLEECGFDVPEKTLDSYVDREMRSIVASMGEDAFDSQLKAQGLTEEAFRKDAASHLMDALRLEIILDAIALGVLHKVTDDERREKITERMLQDGAGSADITQAADEILCDIKSMPSRLRSLEKDIRRDKALEWVTENAEISKSAPMTTDEFVKFDRANMPRM